MAFDYRQFLAENKLTKVSKGRETGKAQILSEGLQILEEGEQWVGKFTTDTYSNLVQTVQNAQGKCSFNLNGKDFTVRPRGERFLVTSGVGDFGYEALDIEGACKAAYQYSTGNLKEGFDTEMGDLDEYDALDMMEANAQKDAYLKRKEREKRGNWTGSVGAFVEKHGEDIAKLKTLKDIDVFIENVMVPELGNEAIEYVRDLRANCKSPYKFIMALYNATLKGSGLGLHEASTCSECGDWDETEEVAWEDDGDEYPVEDEYLNEAVEQKFKGTPQEKGSRTKAAGKGYKGRQHGEDQDKMAREEMKGETMDVTIGGVTKTVSTRAYKAYRKMADPEKKKAWKKKYGFIKESKVLKEGLEGGGVEETIKAIWNHYRAAGNEDTGLNIYIDGALGEHPGRVTVMDGYDMVELDSFQLPGLDFSLERQLNSK